MKKYRNKLPTTQLQKVNEYIKEVGKIVGIDQMIEVKESKGGIEVIKTKPKYELLSTHVGRRTGATLMYLSGLPSKDIMVITRHKTLASFEVYLKLDQKGAVKRMEESPFFKYTKLKIVN